MLLGMAQLITINTFAGANTKKDPLTLPSTIGVLSVNQRPSEGDFLPWAALGVSKATVPSGAKTIYRMGQSQVSESQYWLSWSSVVSVARGFDPGDTTERIYFTGDGGPKWTDASKALTPSAPYPQAARDLGVPAPTGALTVAINAAGTGDLLGTTNFVYTFVNDLGWESAPSPLSNYADLKAGSAYNLTGFDVPPAGSWGIATVRLYQLVRTSSNEGEFKLLKTWAVGVTPANPIGTGSMQADVLETEGWRPPPVNSKGIKKLWAGMHSVLTDRAVRFSEVNKPYAYKLRNEIGIASDPVAQAVWGSTLLVLTKGDPVAITGSEPASMADEPLNIHRPCMSERSVVEFNDGAGAQGIVWASKNDLCWIGDGGFKSLTASLMTEDQWRSMNPETMVAGRYRDNYVCFYTVDGLKKGFVINPHSPSGIYFLSTGYDAMFLDPSIDKLMVLSGVDIKAWNEGAGSMLGQFVSKVFTLESPTNFGALQVVANGYPVTAKLRVWTLPTAANPQGQQLEYTLAIQSNSPIRPPGGFLASRVQLELSSQYRIIQARIAESMADLRSIG